MELWQDNVDWQMTCMFTMYTVDVLKYNDTKSHAHIYTCSVFKIHLTIRFMTKHI